MSISRFRKTIDYVYCTPKSMFVFALAVLVIFYLPAFISLYPGTLGYDGPVQLDMYFGGQPVTMHHPVFHTWLMGSLITAGEWLFGSPNAGLALYCAVQGGIVLVSLAGVFGFLRKYGVPFPALLVLLLWTAWNPYLQVITFATTKDVLFSAFFLDFLLLLMTAAEEKEHCGKRIYILMGSAALLLCMTRNQGIYLIAGICLFVLILCREKKILLTLAGAVVCMLCISSVNTHLLHIPKGDAREMLSVPVQQVARVLHAGDEADITEEQKEAVYRVIPEEGIETYSEWIADPVKSYVKTAELKKDIPGYLRLYLQLGKQNPGVYYQAFDDMVSGFFHIDKMNSEPLTFTWTFLPLTEKWGFYQEDLLHLYRRVLTGLVDPDYTHARPVLHTIQPLLVIFQPVASIVILFAALLAAILCRKRIVLILCLAGALYFLTMLLGPAALIRYAYPLMLLVPLYAGLGFSIVSSWIRSRRNAADNKE